LREVFFQSFALKKRGKMKLLDDVVVINDNYKNHGIVKGKIGTIIEAAIRENYFLVVFPAKSVFDDDIISPIKIEDLELVSNKNVSDEMILNDLPNNNPKWWCKVEDGYIMNLLGDRKNKIPYDYNS